MSWLTVFLHRLIFSFPVQLLILNIKKNQLQFIYWILLFCIVTRNLLNRYGLPYLFLDPEYMGRVSGWSFFIMGLTFATFVMAFNISSFLLNAHHFPFLATLSRTFYKYCINNFILVVLFLAVYMFELVQFQYFEELRSLQQVAFFIVCFFLGYTIVAFLVFRYFLVINKDMYKMFMVKTGDDDVERKPLVYSFRERKLNYDYSHYPAAWHVESYLSSFTKVKVVRDVSHYEQEKVLSVFKQNHLNAAVFEMVIFLVFFSLGLLSDVNFFKIPAGASILLLFTLFVMLTGVVRYYLKNWATSFLIIFFLLLNYLSHFESFNKNNLAYGLNYKSAKQAFDLPTLEKFATKQLYDEDVNATTQILEKWKKKWQDRGVEKPKMLLLNISGGGVRSMVFTFRAMQAIDSALAGDLMHYTPLITGSSGGIISASYYRQLYLENNDSLQRANLDSKNIYLKNVGKDMLNAIAFKLTVSDIFMNFQSFDDGKYRYMKDRGYAWESQLNTNLNNVLNKRLVYYKQPEKEAMIPMVFITPTIINDGRAMFISPQKISYMLQNTSRDYPDSSGLVNGIEFTRFFADQDAMNLQFTSALRVNSAFPWISPVTSFPSEPVIEAMDAGIRDNFGLMNSMRFLDVFKDWIYNNTSGVVVVQIRDTYKKSHIYDTSAKTFYDKLATPFRNVSGNFLLMQDYSNDAYIEAVRANFKGNINFINFELPESHEKVSLNWHLTKREKEFLKLQVNNPDNSKALRELKAVLSH
ncbi:MAG: patatin-like phospholipase family protein [Bacteroidia bacterium]